jgi:peptidase E
LLRSVNWFASHIFDFTIQIAQHIEIGGIVKIVNIQQPVYLFAGGRGKSIAATFSSVRNVIKSTGKKRPEIAFVGAASLKDNWLIYAILAGIIKFGCSCRVRRVVIAPRRADLDKARDILCRADAVFVSGGDVEVGMQVLKEKNMVGFLQDLARQGKLFIGASAGSIMLSAEWVRWRDPKDDASAELFSCLGIVPIICDTHAEKDNWAELKTALQLKKDGRPGYGITSGAYLKVYPDGRLEAESGPIVRYIFRNGTIECQPDLLPGGGMNARNR